MKRLGALLVLALLLCFFGADEVLAESPGSHLLLLAGKNAQREIDITPIQRKAIERLVAEYRKEVAPFLKQKDAQAAAMHQASMRAFDKRARALLTSAQLAKLYVVEAKTLGPWVLHSPAVQEQLVLTDKQISRINRVAQRAAAYNDKLHREVDSGKITNEQRIEKMREFRIRESRSLERLLNSTQREQLRNLARRPR